MNSMRMNPEFSGRGDFGRGGRERFRQRADWQPGWQPDFERGSGGPEGRGRRGGPGGPRSGRGGGRARRGDVRAAVLALLSERPMHGYEMIQELEARTGGVWRPSPGALYPALQLLGDEGLVTADEASGKRLLTLTEAGRAAAEAAAATGERPWEQVTAGVPQVHRMLRDGVHQIGTAARQVAEVGTEDQKAKAAQILADTRKALYKLLADSE
jgi:DNA-binding PadR family transcriptional regulator